MNTNQLLETDLRRAHRLLGIRMPFELAMQEPLQKRLIEARAHAQQKKLERLAKKADYRRIAANDD